MSVSDPVERLIVECLIDSALGADCSVSVFDGEAFPLRRSRDPAAILAALGSTDEDRLVLHREGKRLGSILLIYGNGPDLISDVSWHAGTTYEGSWLDTVLTSALRVFELKRRGACCCEG